MSGQPLSNVDEVADAESLDHASGNCGVVAKVVSQADRCVAGRRIAQFRSAAGDQRTRTVRAFVEHYA